MMGDAYEAMDAMSRPKTNRAHAESELDELRARLGTTAPRVETRLRVRGAVRILSPRWIEFQMQLRLDDGMPWLDVTASDHPLIMQRFEGDGKSSMFETYFERVFRRFVAMDGGIQGWYLAGFEERTGVRNFTELRCWATLVSEHGVAVRTREDGMLNVYGLH